MNARRTVALFALLSMGAACTLLNLGDLDDYRGSPPAPPTDGDLSDVEAGFCGRRPPPRPARAAEGANTTTLFFALDDARWREDGGAYVSGFDLDGFCSCPGPCRPLGDAGEPQCDQPEGIDTAGNAVLDNASVAANADIGQEIKRGRDNLILAISYNGRADDDQAQVALLSTAGLEGLEEGGDAGPDGGDASPDGGRRGPKFDGNDRYTVDPISFNGTFLASRDDNAYVTGNTFSADARGFKLKLGRLETELSNGVITGRLEQRDGLWHIVDGRIAAAVPTQALQRYLVRAKVCPGDPYFIGAQGFLCKGTDMRVGTFDPAQGAPVCDAFSVALAFSATQLRDFDPAKAERFARPFGSCPGVDANAIDCDY